MKRKKKEYLECAAFTVPSLFLVMLVFYIPFVMSLYYSLTEWNGISKAPKFIGLENFKKLFFRFHAEPDLYRQVHDHLHDPGKHPGTGDCSSSCTEDPGCERNEEYVLHSVYYEYDYRRFHLEIHFFTGICSTL